MSRYLTPVIFAFLHQSVISQTIWSDGFSDSNFTANPQWLGDTALFVVNGQQQLQLNAPAAAATASLYTPSSAAVEATWEFFLRMNFNPSASNYAEVFLMTTGNHPAQPQNGYLVRLGGTSQDKITLLRRTGTSNAIVAESAPGILDMNNVLTRVRITRDTAHTWTVEADTTGGQNFKLYATGTDATHQTSTNLMMHCVYTSTRSTSFFFDDFLVNGNVFVDIVPPVVVKAEVLNSTTIALDFSEPMEAFTATSTANYTILNPPQKPVSVALDTLGMRAELLFADEFTSGQTFELEIREVEDLAGNAMVDTVVSLMFFRPEYRSVVISEIMSDPTPVVGLPDAEYVEIHNPGIAAVNLRNWYFAADRDTFQFPEVFLNGGEYLLITRHADTVLFNGIPKQSFSFPSGWLLNGGEPLAILNSEKKAIDALWYDINWYNNDAKDDGGWSLELIDNQLSCHDPGNWSASNHAKGGTPGASNVPEGVSLPGKPDFQGAIWVSDIEVHLMFGQGLAPGLIPAIQSSWPLMGVNIVVQQQNRLQVNFAQPITGEVQLIIMPTAACSGFFEADTLVFGLPAQPEPGDLVLNEILFNPPLGGNDFVEIWNTSSKTFLAKSIRLCQLDEQNQPNQVLEWGESGRIISPKNFFVMTATTAGVCNYYNCGKRQFFSQTSMPSLPNSSGSAALTTASLDMLDWVRYSENWHHRLITNRQGVSLERVHPNLPGSSAQSWHSAATAAGYGTPGRLNSQFASTLAQQGSIWLSSGTFSPNNDGYHDVLLIEHRLDAGAMLTLRVFNTAGAMVKVIADNHLTEMEGNYTWDGTTQNGNIAASGIYIIFAEWFYTDGRTGKSKLNVVLAQ